MMDVQTTVSFADKYTLDDFRKVKYDLSSMLVRQCVDTDPVTKVTTVSVFTDDGKGNGNLLYQFDLA